MLYDPFGVHPISDMDVLGAVLPANLGELLAATRKDRYRILRYFSPGTEKSAFSAQITGFRDMLSTPQGGKSKHFSAGKCHLLYFVVVLESLKIGPTNFEKGVSTGKSPYPPQNMKLASLLRSVRLHDPLGVRPINFLCRPSSSGLSQGQTGFVPGQTWVWRASTV